MNPPRLPLCSYPPKPMKKPKRILPAHPNHRVVRAKITAKVKRAKRPRS